MGQSGCGWILKPPQFWTRAKGNQVKGSKAAAHACISGAAPLWNVAPSSFSEAKGSLVSTPNTYQTLGQDLSGFPGPSSPRPARYKKRGLGNGVPKKLLEVSPEEGEPVSIFLLGSGQDFCATLTWHNVVQHMRHLSLSRVGLQTKQTVCFVNNAQGLLEASNNTTGNRYPSKTSPPLKMETAFLPPPRPPPKMGGCLFVCLVVCLSVCLFVCLFVCVGLFD